MQMRASQGPNRIHRKFLIPAANSAEQEVRLYHRLSLVISELPLLMVPIGKLTRTKHLDVSREGSILKKTRIINHREPILG